MNEGIVKRRSGQLSSWADFNLLHGPGEMQLAATLARRWAEEHEKVTSDGAYSPAVFQLALCWLLWDVHRHGPDLDTDENPF